MGVECPWPEGSSLVEGFPCGARYVDIENDEHTLTFVPLNILYSRMMYFWKMSDAERLGLGIEIDGEVARTLIRMVVLTEKGRKEAALEIVRKWSGSKLDESEVERLGRVLAASFNLHRPHHYHQLEACLKCPLADWGKLAKRANAKIRERIGL